MIARFLSRLARTPTPAPAPAVPPAPAAAPAEVGFPSGALDEWRPSWAVMGPQSLGLSQWQSEHVFRPLRVDGQAES